MSKYPNVLAAFYGEAWMILPETLHMMEQILLERASGARLTPEEVQARIGGAGYGQSRDSPNVPDVAVIPLHGPIVNRAGMLEQMSGMTSPQDFASAVREAADDDRVKHIVLDVDTPGGTVSGMHDAAEAVRYAKSKKEVIAVANDLMASAGYYIGAQASKIVVLETSDVGSIGVIMAHRDISAAENKLGLKTTVLYAGKDKAVGNPYSPLSEADRKKLQARLDATREQFVKAVAEGRGIDPENAAEQFPDASLYPGQAAIDAGLADEIGTLASVLASLGVTPPEPEEPDDLPLLADPAPKPNASSQMEESMPETIKKPDMSNVPADVKAYVESLEAKSEAVTEAVEQIDMSTLPEPVRERLEALEAQATADRVKAERAETVANQERDARLTREFKEKAASYGSLNMSAEDLGGILRRASGSMSAEDFSKFEQTLASANEQVKAAAIFQSVGNNGSSAEGSAYAQIETKAKELMASDKNLSLQAAIGKVAESDPNLYAQYQSEIS